MMPCKPPASHHFTSQRVISPSCWKCSEQTATVQAADAVNLSPYGHPTSKVTPEPLKRGPEPEKWNGTVNHGQEASKKDWNR